VAVTTPSISCPDKVLEASSPAPCCPSRISLGIHLPARDRGPTVVTDPASSRDGVPGAQYLDASRVVAGMAVFGRGRVTELTVPRIVVLALLGGGFITTGALFSVLLGTGIEPVGARKLIEGFAFSAGFFFIVLSEAVLFTEANVVLPATLLSDRRIWPKVLRFWALAWLGNLAGAWLFGNLIAVAQLYPAEVLGSLSETVDGKLAYRQLGGAANWWRLVLSGILANWLVGMAAFFAFMGRTIIGKYIPVLLAVMLFVAAGFQHSPANMGFFALFIAHGGDLDWVTALGWNIIPAGIGNVIGAALLVAIPYWFVFHPTADQRR
jgi:formate transporter